MRGKVINNERHLGEEEKYLFIITLYERKDNL